MHELGTPGRVRSVVLLLRGGAEGLSNPDLASWLRTLLTVTLVVTNVIGASAVGLLMAVALPPIHRIDVTTAVLLNGVIGTAYIWSAVAFGFTRGVRNLRPATQWLIADSGPADADVQQVVLEGPLSLLKIQGELWFAGAVVFGLINLFVSPAFARNFVATVALSGLATCAIAYLLSERVLRPVAARAFAGGLPDHRPLLATVAARALLSWALGTTIPVLGLLLVAIMSMVDTPVSTSQFEIAILFLGLIALAIGALATILAARATADPIRSVAHALARVETGDFDVEVPVYDATEIGSLQAGFNSMVAGLREREQIRELFGRQVGQDVARAALEGSIELGGEVRDVAVLFVDLIGSTALASERPATEVVALINGVFGVVVGAVSDSGGWINKFEGDGALAVFGAPIALPDAYGSALSAARRIAREMPGRVPGADVAVGVSAGDAVAGHVGEEQRYEYTVIGDPVNEAARLTELAKSVETRVLASERVLAGAAPEETAHWEFGDTVILRGRKLPTRLASPRPG